MWSYLTAYWPNTVIQSNAEAEATAIDGQTSADTSEFSGNNVDFLYSAVANQGTHRELKQLEDILLSALTAHIQVLQLRMSTNSSCGNTTNERIVRSTQIAQAGYITFMRKVQDFAR